MSLIFDPVLRSERNSECPGLQTVAAQSLPAPGTTGSLGVFSPRDLELLGRMWECLLGGLKRSFRLDGGVGSEKTEKQTFTRILRGPRKTEGGHPGRGAVGVRTGLNAPGAPKCYLRPWGRGLRSVPRPAPRVPRMAVRALGSGESCEEPDLSRAPRTCLGIKLG